MDLITTKCEIPLLSRLIKDYEAEPRSKWWADGFILLEAQTALIGRVQCGIQCNALFGRTIWSFPACQITPPCTKICSSLCTYSNHHFLSHFDATNYLADMARTLTDAPSAYTPSSSSSWHHTHYQIDPFDHVMSVSEVLIKPISGRWTPGRSEQHI